MDDGGWWWWPENADRSYLGNLAPLFIIALIFLALVLAVVIVFAVRYIIKNREDTMRSLKSPSTWIVAIISLVALGLFLAWIL